MNALKFWAVFAVGVTAGAAVALIYAPQTGEKTRKQIKRKLEDAGDYLKDAGETLGERAEKVRGGSGKLNTGEGGGSRLIWPKMA